MAEEIEQRKLVLVARKPCFGLPTACPSCLPVYVYLRLAKASFDLRFNLVHPDSDQIPYVEYGEYVAYNNEKGGVIESLKEDGVVDLDSGHPSYDAAEWWAIVRSWLTDAAMYELWIGSDGSSAHKIYFSDLPWPIGKILHYKQARLVKQLLGITKVNVEQKEAEIYRRAALAYVALSNKLGEQNYFLENRPRSFDAILLGHTLFTLHALPEASTLRTKLLEHSNLVRYTENFKTEFLEAGSSSSIPRSPHEPSSSFTPKRGTPPNWGTKPKSKPKREKTEEEKTFKRRAKYFVATQLIAILVFLSLLGGSDEADLDVDDDDGMNYDD